MGGKNLSLFVSFRFADDVAVGDEVLIHTPDGMVPSEVVKTSNSAVRGENIYYII